MTLSDELLAIAREAVAEGSSLFRDLSPQTISTKSDDRDFVTDLDVRIQTKLRDFLRRKTPDFGFLGEEEDHHVVTDGYLWILDPIDGTSNFIHHIPMCAISLGLVRNGRPIIGVIAAPFLALEYWATADGGAYVNGELLAASKTTTLRRSIISIGDYATGAGSEAKNQRRFAVTTALAASVERVRMLGSAAIDLAWVAEGRLDGCVLLSNNPWDTAAGVLIARESGAVVTDSDGSDHTITSSHTIAATAAISAELLSILSSAD
ncbi:inositol monophosphatase family protein [Nocardia aobensis]|uniref:inositol monophosphatase family protein n=1 Tax=Nocardia aobensis TaxID=257277 RepID=UPI000A05CC69|nr:inositol monophosphatase family protein [Nocardia aobensis]